MRNSGVDPRRHCSLHHRPLSAASSELGWKRRCAKIAIIRGQSYQLLVLHGKATMKGLVDPVGYPRKSAGGGPLRRLWRLSVMAGSAACLLATVRAEATAQAIPETRGRPAPQLPLVQPSTPPAPSLTVPVPPQPSEGAPLGQGPRFILRGMTSTGNTVLDDAAVRDVADPFFG